MPNQETQMLLRNTLAEEGRPVEGANCGADPVVHAALAAAQTAGSPALARQEGGGHYKAMKIQPFEYIHANSLPFAEGSVIKYVSRWRAKNGVEDLKKARHFLDLLIEAESKK